MSEIEILARMELLNQYKSMIAEELIENQYIVRWNAVLSTRSDTTAFKKVTPEIHKACTGQVPSRCVTINI